MSELKELIISAQTSNQDAMYEIVTKFSPIVDKYTRRSNNDEDIRSDLILHLIETVYNIDLSIFRIPNDYALINYISNALYHKYIFLSKKRSNIRSKENHFETEDIEEWLGIDESGTTDIDNVLLINILRKELTKREYDCTTLMIIEGLSSAEAASILGISRQTVNENKNRGLKKLKKIYHSLGNPSS